MDSSKLLQKTSNKKAPRKTTKVIYYKHFKININNAKFSGRKYKANPSSDTKSCSRFEIKKLKVFKVITWFLSNHNRLVA